MWATWQLSYYYSHANALSGLRATCKQITRMRKKLHLSLRNLKMTSALRHSSTNEVRTELKLKHLQKLLALFLAFLTKWIWRAIIPVGSRKWSTLHILKMSDAILGDDNLLASWLLCAFRICCSSCRHSSVVVLRPFCLVCRWRMSSVRTTAKSSESFPCAGGQLPEEAC